MSSGSSINFVMRMDTEDSPPKAGEIRNSSDCGDYFCFITRQELLFHIASRITPTKWVTNFTNHGFEKVIINNRLLLYCINIESMSAVQDVIPEHLYQMILEEYVGLQHSMVEETCEPVSYWFLAPVD